MMSKDMFRSKINESGNLERGDVLCSTSALRSDNKLMGCVRVTVTKGLVV